MKFVIVTEIYQNREKTRKIMVPFDMIAYVQNGDDVKDTYVALRALNEYDKCKYLFIKENVDDIKNMILNA